MPLDDNTFKDDLKTAFEQQTWDLCADKISEATDNYLKTGTVATVVTGTITLPVPPGGTTPGAGIGVGTINDTQLSTLKNAIKAAFQQMNWDSCAQAVANAIDSHLQSAKADIADSTILVGQNSSTTIVTTAGSSDLMTDIKSAFQNGMSWKERDAWVTGTEYVVNAMVMNSSQQYKCLIAHTSGVFANDLSSGKWTPVANDSMTELLKEAVKKFIKACVVNTNDSGNVPPASWTGTGIGAIT
jgi:hypothetical protein